MYDDADSEIDSDADREDDSNTDTSVVGEISSDDVTEMTDTIDAHTTESSTDLADDTTLSQNLQCEPLDETWMCSSGSTNHSLCIKFCTAGLDLSQIDSSHVTSIFLYNSENPIKRWPNRTQEMFMQAERMLLGSKK